MSMTLADFSRHLVESTLLSQENVTAVLDGLPSNRRPKDGEQLARELVRQNKLTVYQAQQLFQGRAKQLVLGNYVVLDQLGKGGMGVVLRAEHKRMHRQVALKVLSAKAMKSPDAVKRFHREVEAAAKLNHAHIVTAFDADEFNGTHFLVMEYVQGSDLSSHVKQNGPLPLELAVECVRQAAAGLEYAHSRGVIHRDIKPANLLATWGQAASLSASSGSESVTAKAQSAAVDKLAACPHVKILDMGLARIESDAEQAELTGTGQVMGTIDYMAPEQALNTKQADARSDIYSLGMSLWYVLTGKAAYDGDTLMARLLAHREKPIPSLCECVTGGPAGMLEAADRVFAKMVAKSPQDRYQSMTEVLAALDQCRAGGSAGVTAQKSDDEDQRLGSKLREQAAPSIAKAPVARPAPLDKPSVVAKPPAAKPPSAKPAGPPAKPQAAPPVIVAAAPPAPKAASKTSHAIEETFNTGQPSSGTDSQLERLFAAAAPLASVSAKPAASPKPAAAAQKQPAWMQDKRILLAGAAVALVAVLGLLGLGIGAAMYFGSGETVANNGTNADGSGGLTPPGTGGTSGSGAANPAGAAIPLTELNTSAWQLAPWPSADGLRLYYEGNRSGIGIYMASRQNVNAKFGTPVFVADGRMPSLSGDELGLVCLGHGTSPPLMYAKRTSRDVAFPTPVPIPGLQQELNPKSPCISADGLALLFQRGTGNGIEIAETRRVSRDGTWSTPTGLSLWTTLSRGRPPTWPWRSEDGRVVFWGHGGDEATEIWNARRVSTTTKFSDFQPVKINGQTLLGRSPRYCEATGELFFSRIRPDGSPQKTWELAVLKDYWPQGKKPAAVSPLSPTGAWIDVIPLINVNQPGTIPDPWLGANKWTKENGALIYHRDPNPTKAGYLHFPVYSDTGNVEIELDYTYVEGEPQGNPYPGRFNLNLPGDQRGGIPLAIASNGIIGDGISANVIMGSLRHVVGSRYKLLARLYRQQGQDHIEVEVNGRQVARWSGDRSRLVMGNANKQVDRKETSLWIFEQAAWRFHSIRMRSIDGKLTAASATPPEGYAALFNGRDLTGWEVMQTTGTSPQDQSVHTLGSGGWEVRSGVLVCTTGIAGWLKTKQQYGDFDLQVDFKLPAGSNSGVYIRSPDAGHLSSVGMKVQIIEGVADNSGATGSIARAANAVSNEVQPAGEWNHMEIHCQGDDILVRVNGVLVTQTSIATNAVLRDRPRRGYIGLANWMGQAQNVEFRNIWIKELRPASETTPSPPAENPPSGAPADAVAYDGKWYRYYSTLLNWKEARDMCVSLGGDLVVIESAEENLFVAQHIEAAGGIEAWIGATDAETEAVWTSPSGARLAYTNWAPSQPNNKGKAEHFALMVKATGWKWADQPKNSTQHRPGFVCEWTAKPTAEPAHDGDTAFLATNAKQPGIITTKSGLQYRVVARGTGPSPKATDTVKVHYVGTFTNGAVFDNSRDRGQPAELSLKDMIAGWAEALQLMRVGDRFQLFVPAGLAYGARGVGGKIGPNAALLFDLELLEIVGVKGASDGSGWRTLVEADFLNLNTSPETWTWTAEGVNCSGTPSGILRSKQKFTDFELIVQWRHLQSGGNSGVFVWVPPIAVSRLQEGRMPASGIELQMLDHKFVEEYAAKHGPPDWFTSHGDVLAFGNTKMKPFAPAAPRGLRSLPKKRVCKGAGEWNEYYVRAVGGELRLWVNGEEVAGGEEIVPASGYLCLQSEGSPIEFRNLRIKEAGEAPPAEAGPKWVDLFNGRDLTGWREFITSGQWSVKGGVIAMPGGSGGGWLATEKEYSDFELELEYKQPPRANSGIFLRIPDTGNLMGSDFLEVQLIPDSSSVLDYQRAGALYRVIAATVVADTAADTWHKLRIRAVGPQVTTWINDRQIAAGNVDTAIVGGAPMAHIKRRSGRIGLQRHGTPIEFRNIRIKEL